MTKQRKSKRANGEGSITKRHDGIWMARYTFNGKRHSIYAKTRKEVQKELNKILADVNQGIFVEPNNITLYEWLIKWLDTYANKTIKITTYSAYKGYIEGHILPHIGNIRLQEIKPILLQNFFNMKEKEGRLDGKKGGLSPKTLRNILNMLNGAFDKATVLDLLHSNPASSVELSKRKKPQIRALSEREQAKLVKHVLESDEPCDTAILFSLLTGTRSGEVCGLFWSDFTRDFSMVRIERTLIRVTLPKPAEDGSKTEIRLLEPKTENSIRDIPITIELADIMNTHKEDIKAFKKYKGEIFSEDDFVFLNTAGNPCEPSYIGRRLRKIYKKLNIEKANFQTLRHTFATRAVERGMKPHTLSKLMGHYETSFTMDTYVHSDKDNLIEGMELMSNMI